MALCGPGVLGATYSVESQDNVVGRVALCTFAGVFSLKVRLRRVGLVAKDHALRFRSRAVVDAVLAASLSSMRPALCEAS